MYSRRVLRALRDKGNVRSYGRGDLLILEGDIADRVLLIENGHVKITCRDENGDEVILAVRGPGDLIGELSALDRLPRTASAQALEDCEATVVPASVFESLLSGDSDVMSDVSSELIRKLRESETTNVALALLSVDVRVARRLLDLSVTHGRDVVEGVKVTLPLSQDELARWVGASREAVARVLRSLRRAGIIRTRRREFTIVDLPALERRAHM